MLINITTIIAVVSGLCGVVFAFIGVLEYRKQNIIKRAENFHILRKKFKTNDVFNKIRESLLNNDNEIKNISPADKTDFLGFYEEVAIMRISGIITKKVAYYMFGYYAIKCWESKDFWADLNRESIYWSLFKEFAETMKGIEKNFVFRQKDYKI